MTSEGSEWSWRLIIYWTQLNFRGTAISLKLSPNLRIMVKPPKKQQHLDQHTLQCQKLEKLLSLVREVPEGDLVKDTATTVASGRN